VTVACVAYGVMLFAERRWGGLTIGLVVVATIAPVLAALWMMPRNGDLWSYATYGRILGVHHLSPWTHTPSRFPNDPFHSLVGRTWRHTPSVYGPVFNAVSGAGAAVLGPDRLPTRLFYQGLATVALGGAGWMVWRRTRSAAAVAFLTVHPLVILYLVNAGRNDIIVGAALLAAVVLAAKHRPGAAGAVGALGALVKLTGLVGVVALLVVTAMRGSRVAVRRMALAAAAVFGGGYLVAGTTALLAPMRTAGHLYSRGSPWNVLATLGVPRPDPHVALAVVAVLVVVVLVRHARGSGGSAVAASAGMLALAAAYTLPGYSAWALPTAALDHRSRVSRIVAATGVLLVMTYELLLHPVAGPAGDALRALAAVGPLLMIVLVVALVRTRGDRPDVAGADTVDVTPASDRDAQSKSLATAVCDATASSAPSADQSRAAPWT
jgi:hypothetical protein